MRGSGPKCRLRLSYPTDRKADSANIVSAAQLQFAAWLTPNADPTSDKFSMQAELDEDTPLGMSGMSGGPVYHVNVKDGTFTPIGITFEGTPFRSLPDVVQPERESRRRFLPETTDVQSDGEKPLFDRRLLYILAYKLSPEHFAGWLKIFNQSFDAVLSGGRSLRLTRPAVVPC